MAPRLCNPGRKRSGEGIQVVCITVCALVVAERVLSPCARGLQTAWPWQVEVEVILCALVVRLNLGYMIPWVRGLQTVWPFQVEVEVVLCALVVRLTLGP